MREHRLKKNRVKLDYNGINYDFVYKRNYHGFRGDEVDPSLIEAVIIGGSTTDERYKPYDLTITYNLNSLLQKKGYNFKIINAGIEGQSSVGHIFNFKHWFPKLKNFSPKLYIFYIGINDFATKADYKITDNKGGDGHVVNPELLEVWYDTFKSNSFFYDKLRILKQKYYLTDRVVQYNHNFFDPDYIAQYTYMNYSEALNFHNIKQLQTEYEDLILNYKKRIETLNEFVKINNGTAIFIPQVLDDGLKSMKRLFILYHTLVEYCNENDINYINLADNLVGNYNYWSDGMHTTGLGSQVIAESLIEDLDKIIKKEKIF